MYIAFVDNAILKRHCATFSWLWPQLDTIQLPLHCHARDARLSPTMFEQEYSKEQASVNSSWRDALILYLSGTATTGARTHAAQVAIQREKSENACIFACSNAIVRCYAARWICDAPAHFLHHNMGPGLQRAIRSIYNLSILLLKFLVFRINFLYLCFFIFNFRCLFTLSNSILTGTLCPFLVTYATPTLLLRMLVTRCILLRGSSTVYV